MMEGCLLFKTSSPSPLAPAFQRRSETCSRYCPEPRRDIFRNGRISVLSGSAGIHQLHACASYAFVKKAERPIVLKRIFFGRFGNVTTAQVDEIDGRRQDSFAYVDQIDELVCVCGINRLTKCGIAVEGGSIKIMILQNRR